jgi:hypothetical protein
MTRRSYPRGMSYSFYVRAPRPRWSDVTEGLGFADLRCVEDAPLRTPAWPDGFFHFYREGISTRSVEVCWENGSFQTRVMTCSTAEEYELALAMVCRVASIARANIRSEEGVEFAPEDAGRVFGPDWVEQMVGSGFRALAAIAEREGEVHLSGPRRPFVMGPRLLSELRAGASETLFGLRTLAAMRRLQYVDTEEDYFAASTMAVRDKSSGREFTLAAWAPGVRYLFGPVEYLALVTADQLLVPYERLAELAGPRLRWLDEQHALVEEIPDEEWDALVARARQYEAHP